MNNQNTNRLFVIVFLIYCTYLTPIAHCNTQRSKTIYWIEFSDKETTKYNQSNMLLYLSQEAINRREKHNIPLDITDYPINSLYIERVKLHGAQVKNNIKWLNGILVTAESESIIQEINKEAFVKNIIEYKIEKSVLPSKFNNTNDNPNPLTYPSTIHNGQFLHENGFSGQGITIAIIDAGFFKVNELPVFKTAINENRIIATYDFVDNKINVYNENTHGMHVFSLIAANKPDDIQGSAPKANYILLRSEDDFSESQIEELYWVDAAEYADSIGVDIISSSLGYSEFDNNSFNYEYIDLNGATTIISKACELASKKGILVVTSAGNEGNNNWNYITAPADADRILSVGSINSDLSTSIFSSKGPSADGRIKPEVVAIGNNVKVQNIDGSTISGSGTSFSAPTIAGLAACLWQTKPMLSNTELIKIITEASNNYKTPNNYIGYGIPDFKEALKKLRPEFDEDINKFCIISPNPISNNSEIRFTNPQKIISLTIVDTNGKKHFKNYYFGAQMESIKLTNLEVLLTGVYFVIINTNESIHSYKIVKI